MRILVLTLLLFALAGQGAMAQIKIIREDGSEVVFDPGDTKPPVEMRRVPEQKTAPKSMPESISEPVIDDVVEEYEEPAEEKPKAVQKKPAPVKKKPRAKKVVRYHGFPLPLRKPPLPMRLRAVHEKAPEAVISENAAIGIAIEYAPPTTDFRVFKRWYEGERAYTVIFKTDDKPIEVIVNAHTGEVMN